MTLNKAELAALDMVIELKKANQLPAHFINVKNVVNDVAKVADVAQKVVAVAAIVAAVAAGTEPSLRAAKSPLSPGSQSDDDAQGEGVSLETLMLLREQALNEQG